MDVMASPEELHETAPASEVNQFNLEGPKTDSPQGTLGNVVDNDFPPQGIVKQPEFTPTVILFGPSGTGKSSIFGQLCILYEVSELENLEFCKDLAKKLGKPDSYLALFMASDSERRSGRTEMLNDFFLSAGDYFITMIDSPGSKEGQPELIKGLLKADLAYLVVSGVEEEFKEDNSYKEFLLLAKAAGISQVKVIVSKMDVRMTEEFENRLHPYLKTMFDDVGFQYIGWIHVSALRAYNIQVGGLTGLHPGTLVDDFNNLVNAFALPQDLPPSFSKVKNLENQCRPFRLSLSGVSGCTEDQSAVWGKILAGTVEKSQEVLLAPDWVTATVDCVASEGYELEEGKTGNSVYIRFTDYLGHLCIENVLCDLDNPIPMVEHFLARITVFRHDDGILCDLQRATLFMEHRQKKVVVEEVVSVREKDQEVERKGKLLAVHVGQEATVRIHVLGESNVSLELFRDHPKLSRFVLLDEETSLIAGGVMTEALE